MKIKHNILMCRPNYHFNNTNHKEKNLIRLDYAIRDLDFKRTNNAICCFNLRGF